MASLSEEKTMTEQLSSTMARSSEAEQEIMNNSHEKKGGMAVTLNLNPAEEDMKTLNYETQGGETVPRNPDEENLSATARAEIMPLPSPGTSQPRGEQAPGAYAQAPRGVIYTNQRGSETVPRPPTSTTTTANAGTEELAVAQPVTGAHGGHHHDSNTTSLPQAQHFDVEANARRKQQASRRRNYFWGFAALCLLVGVLIVVLLVLLVVRNDDDKDNTSLNQDPVLETTNAPLVSVEDRALGLFPQDTIDTIGNDPDSPQAKALEWLVLDIENHPTLSDDRLKQRFVLVTLYFATNGRNWLRSDGWLDHFTHECDWFTRPDLAMRLAFEPSYQGYQAEFDREYPKCNVEGQYLHFWLDQNNIVADQLPEELFWLTSLRTLSIGMGQLRGTLSPSVGRLTNLEGLAIFNQEITGTIPTQVGLLSNLRLFKLSSNDLEGSLPTEMWQLTALSSVILGPNPRLQGTIPTTVGLLSHLRWLMIDTCSLTGTLPTQLGQIYTLEWLVLFNNEISGQVPSQLGLLQNMIHLSLRSNDLTGTIPSQLGGMTATTLLSLGDNHLEGSIPSQMGLLTNLTMSLELHDNDLLEGTIPTELGALSLLQNLHLQNNQISGLIPSQLALLTHLEWLGLESNALEGSIPEELAAMQSSLHTLQLKDNPSLSGIVPSNLCSLNGSCVAHPLLLSCVDDDDSKMTSFDCTTALCGCDCTCR